MAVWQAKWISVIRWNSIECNLPLSRPERQVSKAPARGADDGGATPAMGRRLFRGAGTNSGFYPTSRSAQGEVNTSLE